MPDEKDDAKTKIIIAALMVISLLGVVTYYDSQGNVIVSNETHNVTVDNTTKIIDERMNETTTVKVVYEGATPIKDSLATKSLESEKTAILKNATDSVMSKVTYPYDVAKPAESTTTFKIVKYRCDEKMGVCGYWVEATRDGQEVYTNSPIWISPPPYEVIVSESYDYKTNELTAVLKEDPKLAAEQVLQRYVNDQPLGKAKVDKE